MINKLHNDLKENKIKELDLANKSIKEAKESNLNAFVTIIDNPIINKTDNILSGIPYSLKDNFSTKGILSTGSSNTLKDYVPYFDATVVEKLKEKGATLIGKNTLDELGMGATGLNNSTGPVKNPWNLNKITGGSSSGGAASVASGIVSFALGTDTGDSIRVPAAYCGIVGYKPTYGMVSRYGVFPFASSLDTVGVLSRSVMDAAIVINEIKGIDKKDMTSWDSSKIDLVKNINEDVKGKKLFYIKEICDENPYDKEFKNTLKICCDLGIKVKEISIDKSIVSSINPAYLAISSAEATSNMSNLTGLIFGPRGKGNDVNEMMKDYRTKGFLTSSKKRLVLGSYVLNKKNQEIYLKNPQRLRTLIVNMLNDLFKEYDGMILPGTLSISPDIDNNNNNNNEGYLAMANFGGYPSITIPSGFVNNMPIGVNITGNIKDDSNILSIAYALESKMNYQNQIAKENK